MTPARAGDPARHAGGAGEGLRGRFEQTVAFPLDRFQRRAMDAIDRGESVLVSAPTGSGKTLIADYAAARALDLGGKAFYTTPIKALSNQKFAELSARYGEGRVGLLTGDVSHQAHAPIVVMTTEVLRNMLFARSPVLDGLEVVVLDEVHYLQDPYRGSVWEEVLVLTPAGRLLRQPVGHGEQRRRLRRLAHLGPGDHPGHRGDPSPGDPPPPLRPGRAGAGRPHGAPLAARREGQPRRGGAGRPEAPQPPASVPGAPAGARWWSTWPTSGMLPAITFIFSRAACDDATRQCLQDGIRLTTPEERVRIRQLTEAAVERLSDDDLRTLGYGPWSAALEAGIAPHHAGLVPAFRQAVEQCFSEGLLKVVFATETLALGINMPARTVVVERFAKFRGSDTSALTSGEYRQLTGRAGRRGIDTVGHAMVLWSAGTPFTLVARTATAPPPDLVSSFHPTYNLAVNLVRRWSRDEAHALLAASYGQWQAPPGSESLAAQLDRRLAILEERGFIDGWRITEAGSHPGRRSTTSRICWSPRPCARGCSTISTLAALAGVASALTFEARRTGDQDVEPRQPVVVERLARLDALTGGLRADERRVGLRRTRRPDHGLARAVVAWAKGSTLDSVLRETDVAPGDFVRNVRQLIDLVRQLSQVAPDPGPGTPPRWRCSPSVAGWWVRTTRPGWGPRLSGPLRRSVIRACSPTP